MMKVEQNRGSPLEPVELTIPPYEYDVLIPDVDEEGMRRISGVLGVVNLSNAIAEPQFPVQGIVYGLNSRIFVPLIVQLRATSVNVNFLLDTASPCSYLRRETFEALGFTESIPPEVALKIHGVGMQVNLSHGRFESVDLIGQDFFRRIGAHLTVDYTEFKAICALPH
jgi:hypothetical protein